MSSAFFDGAKRFCETRLAEAQIANRMLRSIARGGKGVGGWVVQWSDYSAIDRCVMSADHARGDVGCARGGQIAIVPHAPIAPIVSARRCPNSRPNCLSRPPRQKLETPANTNVRRGLIDLGQAGIEPATHALKVGPERSTTKAPPVSSEMRFEPRRGLFRNPSPPPFTDPRIFSGEILP